MDAGIQLSYDVRLQTFLDHWNDSLTTARQLAATGHVCDRPPLESLEEGSRCVDCGKFCPKAVSVQALEGPMQRHNRSLVNAFSFHEPKCTRLSLRIPILDGQKFESGSVDFQDMRRRWEQKIHRAAPPISHEEAQTSSLFALPTELRLQIYSYILPTLSPTTEIMPLHSDSLRMTTRAALVRPRARVRTLANILQTCKTVHSEALDLFYTSTTLEFGSTRHLYLFLRQIGHAGRRRIKAVDVQCAGREDAVAFALLASCEELQSLSLRLPRPMLLWARPPLWVSDGVACLLSVSGLERVHFGKCESRAYMKDDSPDAAVIKRELTRPRGTPSQVRLEYWTCNAS